MCRYLGLFFTVGLFLLAAGAPKAAGQFGDSLEELREGLDTDVKPPDVVIWHSAGASEQEDTSVVVGVQLQTKSDFTIYKKNLNIEGPPGYVLVNTIEPPTKRIIDPIDNKEVDVYYGGAFEFTFKGERWEQPLFPVSIRYIGCTQIICLFPYTERVENQFFKAEKVSLASSRQAFRDNSQKTSDLTQKPADAPAENLDLQSRLAEQIFDENMAFELILLLLFVGGIVSNLTPCVGPMIPITIRIITSRDGSAFIHSCAYALGIVVTYTGLGFGVAAGGMMFGEFMASSAVNLILAIFMGLFGLTMLGYLDLSKVQNLGNLIGNQKTNLSNTFLMGVGAGFIAAPCTGPVLATLLTYASSQADLTRSGVMLFVYSCGFALPYVFLGSYAAKSTSLRIPARTQIGVKYVFAAVMFALVFYYLKIPFYSLSKNLKDHWSVISLAGLAIGSVGVGYYIARYHTAKQKYFNILPTVILGLGLFGASQWFTITSSSSSGLDKLTWIASEKQGYQQALRSQRPILIDMWADWCEACKQMDATTFQDPRVKSLLTSEWVIIKLDLTEDSDENEQIQQKFGLQSLPTLVLLPANHDIEQRHLINGYVGAERLLQELEKFSQK